MLEDSSVEEDADGADVCLCCLKPLAPGANFCGDCGAPVGFFAATLPFQRIFAEGFVYRRAIHTPKSLITVVGIWLIFGPQMLFGYFVLRDLSGVAIKPTSLLEGVYLATQLVVGAWLLIGLAAICMVTRNYLAYVREGGEDVMG